MALACLVVGQRPVQGELGRIHGIGIPGYAILGQSWILDTLQGRWAVWHPFRVDWNGYPLDIHGIGSRL